MYRLIDRYYIFMLPLLGDCLACLLLELLGQIEVIR